MTLFHRIFNILVLPRRVPVRVIVITALASFVLMMGAIIQGQPLYITALFTLLPWIPIFLFESIWKMEHYSWIAFFGIMVVLQLGHLGEHVTQVSQLSWLEGTLACPPVIDTPLNAERAVEAGLRSPSQAATGISASWVIKPDKATGLSVVDANGQQIIGPAACGVFGQLDIEIVHLVWELIGWLATLVLLVKFPRNIWLWITLVVVSIHSVEHLFISWVFFMETDALYNGAQQLWATTVEGKIVTAHPAGLKPALLTFYEAGGKNGIMGKGGLVDALLITPATFLPSRPYLHFWYNFFVFAPTVLAFLVQVGKVYDEYLAKALPELSIDQLAWTTSKMTPVKYPAGSTIVSEGEPADRFYIITKGKAEVLGRQPDGREVVLNALGVGQYFGEIGLMRHTERTATVRALTPVEVITLDREGFEELLEASAYSRMKLEHLIGRRLRQGGTIKVSQFS